MKENEPTEVTQKKRFSVIGFYKDQSKVWNPALCVVYVLCFIALVLVTVMNGFMEEDYLYAAVGTLASIFQFCVTCIVLMGQPAAYRRMNDKKEAA
jgi:hypothetical protein